jgi:CysZ protein
MEIIMNPNMAKIANITVKKNQLRPPSPSSFGRGFSCIFKGFNFVYFEHRELARFYLPPMLFSLLLILTGWILFGIYVNELIAWFWPEPSPDDWWGIAHFLWNSMSFILWIIVAMATAFLTFVMFSLFAAPFSDLISEQTESILGTWEARPFSLKFMLNDLFQSVRLELRRVSIKLLWLTPLFLLSLFVPGIGNFIYVILGGYLLSKFTGMDYIDWCAARRGWTWKERLLFVREHKWPITGLGAAVVLFLMIPLAIVVIWPAAVAGGAILFTSLHKDQPR